MMKNKSSEHLTPHPLSSVKICVWILLLWFCITGSATAQFASLQIRNGYDALEDHNYFKARELFLKTIGSRPVVSSYGLADILQRGNNPFYDLDSAYTLSGHALNRITEAGGSEKKLMAEFGVDSTAIISLSELITQKAFNAAVDSPTVKKLDHFISFYYGSPLIVAATLMRDSIAFRLAVVEGSSSAFRNYIDLYPNSALRAQAVERMHFAQYHESVTEGELSTYEDFIDTYPLNPYINEAYSQIYRLSVEDPDDADQLYGFIKEHHDNPYREDAWQRIYEIYFSKNYGDGAIKKFRELYPDYPFQQKLDEEYLLATTDFLPVLVDGKWGFINPSGVEMIEPRYSSVQLFSEGLALFENGDQVGFVAKNGLEVVPPMYDDAEDFHNGMAIVFRDGLCGAVDRSGRLSVPLIYDEISDFSNGIAAAALDGEFGFIDNSGQTVMPFSYDEAGGFSDGFAVCDLEGKAGIIDASGRIVVPFEFGSIENFRNGIARFRKDERVGLIDTTGTIITEAIYDDIGVLNSGRMIAIRDNKVCYLNARGEVAVPPRYQSWVTALLNGTFRNGYAIFRRNGRFGLMDTSGNVVLKPLYDDMIPVNDSLVPVKRRGKWGVYSLSVNGLVTDYIYDDVRSVHPERVIAKYKGKWCVADYTGDRILPAEYDFIEKLEVEYYMLESGMMKGVADMNGKILIMDDFRSVDVVMKKYIAFKKPDSIIWFNSSKAEFIKAEE